MLRLDNGKKYFSNILGEYLLQNGLFTDQHVLTHHSKMELLKGKINIYWKLHEQLCLPLRFQNIFG